MNIGDDVLDSSAQECVGNHRESVNVQTEAKATGMKRPLPIKIDGEDTSEWKVVMPRGRHPHANVVKREELTKVTFSRK